MTTQFFDPLDGVLLVDKPAGSTSHDVIDFIRDTFSIKKAGHCGTLDPNATGLLVIVIGRATKLSDQLMAEDKAYIGTAKFGEATDSHDADGNVTSTTPLPELSVDNLNEYAAAFLGDQMQTPPMVSAAKKSGKRLYKLARKGIEVERKPKLVHIYQFEFTHYEAPYGELKIWCTKGTYVRSLIHELGQAIGCGAYLASLRRISSGQFSVNDAATLAELRSLSREALRQHIIPFDTLARASG